MKALEFIYQDTQIAFLLGTQKDVMVNATEMAKPFGKLVADFLRLDSTKNFINSYIKIKNQEIYYGISHNINQEITENDLYFSKQKSGTYMLRPLALKFAAWLDSDFEVWVYEVIDNLLFGSAKELGKKITETQKEKQKLSNLIEEAVKNQNQEALAIIKQIEKVRIVSNDEKKGLASFKKQYSLFED